MKKNFQSYVVESNAVIGDFPGPARPEKQSRKSKPALEVIESRDPDIESVIESTEELQDVLVQESVQPIEEEYTEQEAPLVEAVNIDVVALNESIIQLGEFLIEQQNNQRMLGELIAGLVETVRQQNTYIQEKFSHLDEAMLNTSSILQEAATKLEQLELRDINIPAPIVNVSLSEQKKIVKTVDRDSNGLIKQITEEIQQTVSEDK